MLITSSDITCHDGVITHLISEGDISRQSQFDLPQVLHSPVPVVDVGLSLCARIRPPSDEQGHPGVKDGDAGGGQTQGQVGPRGPRTAGEHLAAVQDVVVD